MGWILVGKKTTTYLIQIEIWILTLKDIPMSFFKFNVEGHLVWIK